MVRTKNHRKVMSLVVLLFTFFGVEAQLDTSFVKLIGTSDYERFNDVKTTLDNGYIMAGIKGMDDLERKSDMLLVKTNLYGIVEWSISFGGSEIDVAESVIQCSNGDYMIAGYTNSFGGFDYEVLVARFNPNGQFLWMKTLGTSEWDFAYDLIETVDENYLICGKTFHPIRGDEQGLVIKFNQIGDVIWNQIWGEGGNDAFHSVCNSMTGLIYLSGYISKDGKGKDYWVVETDIEGTFRWNAHFGDSLDDISNSIVETNDGNLVLAGYKSNEVTNKDAWMFKLVPLTNNMLWVFETILPADDEYTDVFEDNNMRVSVIGNSNSVGLGKEDIIVYSVNSDGTPHFGTTFGAQETDIALRGSKAHNGGIVYVGYTNSYGNGWYDGLMVKTRADGTTLGINEDTVSINPTVITSLHKVKNELDVRIYPVPANQFIKIDGFENDLKYSISDVNGRILKSGICNIQTEISLAGINSNLLILTLEFNENGVVKRVSKIIPVY